MKKIILSLALAIGLLAFTQPANAVITYTITSGASGSFTASGNIFDGMTNIGTWTSTLSGTTIQEAYLGTGSIDPITFGMMTAGVATSNSAPELGLFMRMAPYSGPGTPGVQTYSIAFSATVNSGYLVNSIYVSAVVNPGPTNFGPNIRNGQTAVNNAEPGAQVATTPNTNVLTFSGFTGNAVLTETIDNLVQADGATIANNGTLNWKLGPFATTDGDSTAANVNWYVTIPSASAQTITYAANFGVGANGISTTAYNEAVGFGFNITVIPEPSTALLVGAGLFGLLVLRRRLA